jgi:TolA-binding protein
MEAPLARERDLAPPSKAAPEDAWRELLSAGRLSEGLRAAERANFERVCQIASAKELLALADASRLFGAGRRAAATLRVLRQRFPGTMDAATAAFTLGRVAFEKQHAYAEAADWFETYLREQPSGPLMGDSFGRLMEARLRSGDRTAARTSAQQYLRRFPEGPYSSEARGILLR